MKRPQWFKFRKTSDLLNFSQKEEEGKILPPLSSQSRERLPNPLRSKSYLGVRLIVMSFGFLIAIATFALAMAFQGKSDNNNIHVLTVAIVLAICFILFVGLIFLMAFWRGWRGDKKNHVGEPQLMKGEKGSEEEKKPAALPGKPKKKNGFVGWAVRFAAWAVLAVILVEIALGVFVRAAVVTGLASNKVFAKYLPNPTVDYRNESVCRDAWEREAAGVNDHRRDKNIPYFDVKLRPCGDAWIMPPDDWRQWGMEFIDNDPSGCLVSFQFAGGRSTPTYGPNNIPDFFDHPAKWRLRGNGCTLRYFRELP